MKGVIVPFIGVHAAKCASTLGGTVLSSAESLSCELDCVGGGCDWGGCDWGGCDWGGCDWGGCDWGGCDWGGCDGGGCDWGGCCVWGDAAWGEGDGECVGAGSGPGGERRAASLGLPLLRAWQILLATLEIET
jgi:hypothetical protein